ncbi:MAG: hypothetical protein ACR2RA_21520, partial [Geminicoccaceae bacterium]
NTLGDIGLWLDASDAATITESSGDVSDWDDKSPEGRDFTQATGTQQPTTGTPNGRDGILFDGTDDRLVAAAFPGTLTPVDSTMAVVATPVAVGGNQDPFNLESTGGGVRAVIRQTGAGTVQAFYNGTNPDVTMPITNTATDDEPWWFIARYRAAADGDSDVLNHEAGTDTDPGKNDTFTDAVDMSIGARQGGATPFDGYLHEVVVYNDFLTDTEQAELAAYFDEKWLPVRVAVGQALETDTALAITEGGGGVSVGQALESDTAQPITPAKAVSVGQPTETDQALSISPAKRVVVGQATETNTALGVSPAKAVQVGQALETDTALAITKGGIPVGQALESDTAQPITPAKRVIVGQATEINSAQPITAARTVPVGQATETDQALAVDHAKAVQVGQAQESDVALPLVKPIIVQVGIALETDQALALNLGVTDPTVTILGQAAAAIGLEGQATDSVALDGQAAASIKLSGRKN